MGSVFEGERREEVLGADGDVVGILCADLGATGGGLDRATASAESGETLRLGG